MKTITRIAIAFALLHPSSQAVRADTAEDRAFVLAVLKTPPHDPNHDHRYAEHAEDLRPLGDSALPLLAGYLDKWGPVGDAALRTMLEIDPDKAAPFIFAEFPGKVSEDQQATAFRIFSLRLSAGEKVPAIKNIQDAAVRCLERHNQELAAKETMMALGLTGNTADIPLLRATYQRYADRAAKTDNVIYAENFRKLACVAEGAMARLGDPDALDRIAEKLEAPVVLPRDSEKVVLWIEEAGFSGNKRFVPLLQKHLDDTPTPPLISEMCIVTYASPDTSAAIALAQILEGKPLNYTLTETDFKRWKSWGAQKQ